MVLMIIMTMMVSVSNNYYYPCKSYPKYPDTELAVSWYVAGIHL